MRRMLALPVLLVAAALVVAFPRTSLGRRADRLAHDIAHWAAEMRHA